jgi:hypothetical protein
MKVGLVMFYDQNIKNYGNLNAIINSVYCKKYNIDFICSHKRQYESRYAAWERFPLILQHLDNYDYLIWIDADAHFYIDAENICDIIKANETANIIFSKDIAVSVNTGFFIVKNTEYSKQFIKTWAYDEDLYKNNTMPCWWDNGVMYDMYAANTMDILNNSVFINYGILQHFYNNELATFERKPYIIHYAGQEHNYRINQAQLYCQQHNILCDSKIYNFII